MDAKQAGLKLVELLKKYRFALLILVIGLVLMLLPSGGNKQQIQTQQPASQSTYDETFEHRLQKILSNVSGAGEVQVILTVAAGEEVLYQMNENNAATEQDTDIRLDTVTITDSQRNETGLVRQVIPEQYQGAIVVCQGADDPKVQLALVDAVSKLTGLGANCISVLKMK